MKRRTEVWRGVLSLYCDLVQHTTQPARIGRKLRFLEKHVFWSDIRANTTTRSAWCVTTKKCRPPLMGQPLLEIGDVSAMSERLLNVESRGVARILAIWVQLFWTRTQSLLRGVSLSSPDADADAQPLDRDRKVHQSELTGVAGGRDLTFLQIDRSKCADHARELPSSSS